MKHLATLAIATALAVPKPAAAQDRHWAYVRPVRPETPELRDAAWPNNAIDAFVLARLEAKGWRPAPEADRPRLLRRVYLDLIGLPPSPAEVDAFVADDSAGAYGRVVDRLLASPRYGEHWARHWLDLARYADSNGFQADQLRESWAYRDWVIDAFNAGMPFDRFTLEQLAGDLLPNPTFATRIATGFHRTVTCNVEAGVHPEENRVNQVFDRVNTTGTVWLGTTLECAQCHDHKYDPFSQKDYYRLFAFFNNTPIEVENPLGNTGVRFDFYGPKLELPLTAKQRAELARLEQRRKQYDAAYREHVDTLASRQKAWRRRMAEALANPPRWVPLAIQEFRSTGDEDFEILPDKSVLVGGRVPGTATYTATVANDLDGITAFRIDTLTHPSLPGTGPGRGDDARPNFILSELTIHCDGTPVELHSARADHSQPRWDVAQAIDGNPSKGWAIGGGFFKDHWASFRTREPVAGKKLTFTLDQNFGRGRTIGRFRLSALVGEPDVLELPPRIRRLLGLKQLNEKQRAQLTSFFLANQPAAAQLKRQLAQVDKEIRELERHTTLVMVERDEPRETRVMKRGDYLRPSEAVDPGTPAVLAAWNDSWPKNRLGLARWIVDPANPLTARVTVNRWWSQFFGHGIVATEEDFGKQSDAPTHPKLLDWLAVELVESGWSMKHVHKLIAMSATYRQSSRVVSGAQAEMDRRNVWYARGPRFRMTAEMIRDSGLAFSGLLSTKMGGPPVYPPQPSGLWRQTGRNEPKYATSTGEDRFRRGIYVIWRRAAPYPSFVNFDGPDRSACHPKRSRTNTPMQALTLLNDEAWVEIALGLAQRVLLERPEASVDERLVHAFRVCLARRPSGKELAVLRRVVEREGRRLGADRDAAKAVALGTSGFRVGAGVDRVELATWFFVANVLLNLDETITKG